MHMSDALLSPAVGGAAWAATAALAALSARRVERDLPERSVPLMGVTGAFVFAAQMVNFAIPGTGSSGHLGGGLLLAILLGPHAALLTVFPVLAVQALFFADGGLLALGANTLNIGAIPAFVAYPLVYRPLAGRAAPGSRRATVAAVAAAVVGLELGALAVALETSASGVTSLPLRAFLAALLPIHLPIAVVEGLVTAAVVGFLARREPGLLEGAPAGSPAPPVARPRVLLALFAAALAIGGVLSWAASERPDGLEWSIERASRGAEESASRVHAALSRAQERLAVLPDYAFRGGDGASEARRRAGTSAAGILGGVLTLAVVLGVGLALRRFRPGARRGT
ncbi:MAG: cobalamin biosynthesis protein CbiM [Acidobacteria bacterium]|nr:MAG: cobalamin biosynthesis protein CbiM [Acidobacteriota bacterium]